MHIMGMESCGHLEQVNLQMKGNTQVGEECEKIGSDWVQRIITRYYEMSKSHTRTRNNGCHA